MANPPVDTTSPDYGDPVHDRPIDNDNCVSLRTEGPHVLGVTSLGPSGPESDFSNYTTEPSSSGGWYGDGFGMPS